MSSGIRLVPELFQVHNAFDQHGITLNLPRLRGEGNDEYKQRLLDVMAHKADSAYMGLIYGITRELGLELYEAASIECAKDSNGDFLLTNPEVKFEGGMCYLISDSSPDNYTVYSSIDLYDRTADEWYLGGLIDTINATSYFSATIDDDANEWSRSACIFEQSTSGMVVNEDLAKGSTRIKLDNEDLVSGTISVRSPNLRVRVSSQAALLEAGQYYIDLESGTLFCTEDPAVGSVIRYEHRESPKIFKASPVIIQNLQSAPFLNQLFERKTDELGNEYNWLPSVRGIDIINELFSASATGLYWGK